MPAALCPAGEFPATTTLPRYAAGREDMVAVLLLFCGAIAALQAERACVQEMARLNPPTDLVGRVRRILTEAQGGYPDMSAVATQLHVSPRTLVRRLCERGSSFSTLLEEARRRDGVSLLADGTLTTAEIAERLGYSSAASFARAFRKWTGSPPGAWRSRAGADAPAAAAVGRRN